VYQTAAADGDCAVIEPPASDHGRRRPSGTARHERTRTHRPMVGTTLIELRERVESLASDEGTYYLVCARTGERPIPTAGLRFERRATARNAARAAEQYRTALRRYDEQVPYRDLVVCQDTRVSAPTGGETRDSDGDRWSLSEPVLRGATTASDRQRPTDDRQRPTDDRQRLTEFCHEVAAVVFETLCESGYDAVESAVMDAYFELAESVEDVDELCLCLLESVATELDVHLSPAEQAAVLSDAASRLDSRTAAPGSRIDAAFAHLRAAGVVESVSRSPWSVDLQEGTRSVVVRLHEYALSPHGGRLPTLPLVVELYRGGGDWSPASVEVTDSDEEDWRVRLVLAREPEPDDLASVPIGPTEV
jgi:hypothetical protein